jgi:hypothetical protein
MAIKNLTIQIRKEVYSDMGNNMNRVIDRMTSDDDPPLLQYVGNPWHQPTGRDTKPATTIRHILAQNDAHFALLCIQTALDTYLEGYLDAD